MITTEQNTAEAKGYTFEKVNCPLCEKSTPQSFFLTGTDDLTSKPGHFNYVKCENCKIVFQNPRIPIDQIKDFYDSEYIAHRKKQDWGILQPLYERAMNAHDKEKLKIINRYTQLNSSSKVLDVGCAVGTFLNRVRDHYYSEIHGVDFKENLEFPGFENIHFHAGLFYEQEFGPARFDLITMWHFLEHCYNPKESLRKAKEVLSDSGRLVIEVPRLDSVTYKLFGPKWPGVQAPQHTVLFDKKTFLAMLDEAGFEIVDYLPYGAFPPYFYIFAGAWFKYLKKPFDLDRAIAPYFAGQVLMSPILTLQKRLNLAMQTAVLKKKSATPSGGKGPRQ
jgi:SAM-dependent methyltransferase